MKIKIIKKQQVTEDQNNETFGYDNEHEFVLACHNRVEGYSQSQLDILDQFHKELDFLRSEVARLEKLKRKIESEIQSKIDQAKPITTSQLFTYCNNLNKASKGKLDQNKKR